VKLIWNLTFNLSTDAKRILGKSLDEVKQLQETSNWPFKIVERIEKRDEVDTVVLKIIATTLGGFTHEFLPEEVLARIIMRLSESAEVQLGKAVTHAVISVPAAFDDVKKRATKLAAIIAGFKEENIDIIYEPTAAALAYGLENPVRDPVKHIPKIRVLI